MKCSKDNTTLKVIEYIKSDGTTNQPYNRVIAQCPKCKAITNTKYERYFPTQEKKSHIEFGAKTMKAYFGGNQQEFFPGVKEEES